MPRCYPAEPDFPEERRAKRVVLEALRRVIMRKRLQQGAAG